MPISLHAHLNGLPEALPESADRPGPLKKSSFRRTSSVSVPSKTVQFAGPELASTVSEAGSIEVHLGEPQVPPDNGERRPEGGTQQAEQPCNSPAEPPSLTRVGHHAACS